MIFEAALSISFKSSDVSSIVMAPTFSFKTIRILLSYLARAGKLLEQGLMF